MAAVRAIFDWPAKISATARLEHWMPEKKVVKFFTAKYID